MNKETLIKFLRTIAKEARHSEDTVQASMVLFTLIGAINVEEEADLVERCKEHIEYVKSTLNIKNVVDA